MAQQITESCVNCWACVDACPNDAIYQDKPHFLIDDMKWTECLGEFLNAPGSLTGIPEEKLKEFGLWREAA